MKTPIVGACVKFAAKSRDEYMVVYINELNNRISLVGTQRDIEKTVSPTCFQAFKLTGEVKNPDFVCDRVSAVAKARAQREKEREDIQGKKIADVNKDGSYSHLIPCPDSVSKVTHGAKNIRLMLKKHFKGSKFSVRKGSESAIYGSWTDGPTEDAVNSVLSRFKQGSFDGMQDLYEYKDDPFTDVYGGAQYIFTNRSYSVEKIEMVLIELRDRFGNEVIKPEYTAELFKRGELYKHCRDQFSHGLQGKISKILYER